MKRPTRFRKGNLFLICAVLLGGIFFLPPFHAQAKSKWLKLHSPSFEFFTTLNRKQALKLLLFFEQINRFFDENTPGTQEWDASVRIIAFRSEREYSQYRTGESTAAYYMRGKDRDHIVLYKSASHTNNTAVHEYVHLWLSRSGATLPIWLNEGLAELYSTLNPIGSKIYFGAAPQGSQSILNRKKWIDIDILLDVDHASPYYRESEWKGILYAQSWALTHMLYLSKNYRPKFSEFYLTMAAGTDSREAFQKVYGKSPAEIHKDLKTYLRYTAMSGVMDLKMNKTAEEIKVQAATPLETEMILARLLAATNRSEEASIRYTELIRIYPDQWEPHEAFGYLELRHARHQLAQAHFAHAVERGSPNPKLYFDYAIRPDFFFSYAYPAPLTSKSGGNSSQKDRRPVAAGQLLGQPRPAGYLV